MEETTALPGAAPAAEVSSSAEGEAATLNQTTDAAETTEGGEKPQKTPEQREIERMRRRIDRLTRTRYELEARLQSSPVRGYESQRGPDDNQAQAEAPISLTREQLQRIVTEQAQRLVPQYEEQRSVQAKRERTVAELGKAWGAEKFDAIAADLDEVVGGLRDSRGQPKPIADAIFESENPRGVIEYLTDPDHADEAEALARMNHAQAGRAIGRIEARLEAQAAAAKPAPSNAPKPLEPLRSQGGVKSTRLVDLDDAAFAKRMRELRAKR